MDDGPSGERIRLRFVTRDEYPLLQGTYAYEAGGFNDFGIDRSKPLPDAAWTDGRLHSEDRGTFFVERLVDRATLGTVSYHRERYGPNPESGCWNIGVDLVPEARGQGFGTEAQRLLADWLFATTPVNRVEAGTDVENLAEQRSLAKAGFTREGILRGSQWRLGAYHDMVLYSRLRNDPE